MGRKSVSTLSTLLLLSCLALSVFSIDAGVLGISWNVQLATEPADNPRHKHAWMSIVEFDRNVADVFSDAEIAGLARRGFNDMIADFGRTDPPWKDPKNNIGPDQPKAAPIVMTAIVYGQRLFLSSSVRGGGIAYTPFAHPVVAEALIQCQVETGGNTKHRTLAGCGEPMAAHIAFQSGLKSLNGGKIVTWGQMRKGKIGVMKPCGLFDENGAIQDRWGCNAFTRELGLVVIPEDTEARDKDHTPNPIRLPICI